MDSTPLKTIANALSAPRFIDRPRILREFQEALATTHLLLTAPAGYGKSVALRALAAHRPQTHYIPLFQADLDPKHLESRLKSLFEPGQTILLDDIHLLVDGEEVCAWLQEQIGQRGCRWLLAGREIPPLLELLVISGQANHHTKDSLNFSREETALLLDGTPETVDHWHTQLDGWPLALSLASRLATIEQGFSSTKAHLFTYLAETVFKELPSSLHHFMRATAVPLRFDIALAANLWGHTQEAEALFADIQRRNLYLQPLEPEGWYRYHALIRDYLLSTEPDELLPFADQTIRWFEEAGDLEGAIEQALDTGPAKQAERLVRDYKLSRFHRGTRSYLTYRRWVTSLADEVLERNPYLLICLGNSLSQIAGYLDEAWIHIRRGIDAAELLGDNDTAILGKINHALLHYRIGDLESAYQEIVPILADADCEGYPRSFGLRIATLILGDTARYAELPPYFAEVVSLTEALGMRNEPFMNRANHAWLYHTPLGNFAEAQVLLEATLAHFADDPGWLNQYLLYWCELKMAQGNWPDLAEAVQRHSQILDQAEESTMFCKAWHSHYQSVLALVHNDDDKLKTELARYAMLAKPTPLNQLCVAWLTCWHLRTKGRWGEAIEHADRALSETVQAPYHRALLALERDIAQAMRYISGDADRFSLHAATKELIRMRTRPQLVRLRALLAVVCWHEGDSRWQRHWSAAHRALCRPGYGKILSDRDPHLGAWFWRIAIAEEVVVEEASAALVQIGQSEPLYPLLTHRDPAARIRVVKLLAELQNEQSIPIVDQHLSQEADPAVLSAFNATIERIEETPAPPLTIQLMGTFSLTRGEEGVPASAWQRPVVQRLFQYFALHAGETLTKDQLLNDLWPDTDPPKAWNNFRTVYSLLRKVLDPFMRPKAPNRYFMVANESYTFDAKQTNIIDTNQFESVVRTVLRQRSAVAPPTPSDNFIHALQTYAPLLPDLPYAEWLIEQRQRLHELYIEGCLYAAECYLTQSNYGESIEWAKQTVGNAPWLEEAYQIQMRAYARQGQRTLALQTANEAIENLKRELDVAPSEVTLWLIERLRNSAEI